jgi:hypothetical protein
MILGRFAYFLGVVGLAYDLLHASQRGSSIAGAATLAQRSRRYCDPGHMSLLSSSVVMTR